MAFFEHILLNILENKRAKNFENSAKCAYKPIFLYPIKNSISPKCHLRPSCIQPTMLGQIALYSDLQTFVFVSTRLKTSTYM